MNKLQNTLMIILCTVTFALSCQKESDSGGGKGDDKVAVTGVSLNSSSLTMVEGETSTLSATISPTSATNKAVTWSSDNTSVATVDKGTVTAKSTGSAIITVKTDDGGKTATCSVTVNAKTISVTSVSLDKSTVELTEGETCTLTATVSPADASNKNVSWSSSDAAVASVDNTGKVSAIKEGTTTITVKTEDGGKMATCQVTVKKKTVAVTGVTLNKTSVELHEEDKDTLIATVMPENATNKNVTWSSSDESIVVVNNGEITAIKEGQVSITVTTEDGSKKATCQVTVRAKVISVTGVSLDKSSVDMTEGDKIILTATVSPENATNKNVSWASSDESIAKVTNGEVVGVKAGSTTITVTTEDGGKTATCSVTVKKKGVDSGGGEDVGFEKW